MSEELIKKLKDYPAFKEFQLYLLQQINKLDSLDGLEHMTDKQAGEEAKVRSKAKNKLIDILIPFADYKERRKVSEDEMDAVARKFGI